MLPNNSLFQLLKNVILPIGCRMEMENTVKLCAKLLCRLWNEQPEQLLNNDATAHSPKLKMVQAA